MLNKNLRWRAGAVAAALASLVGSAGAVDVTVLNPTQLSPGSTFTDFEIGSIVIGSLSNLVGSVFDADSLTATVTGFGTVTINLSSVTFSSASVGTLTDLNNAADGFSFQNVAAGVYSIKASGTVGGTGPFAYIGAQYSITAVPEPEAYTLMLAGLGVVGFVATRRRRMM